MDFIAKFIEWFEPDAFRRLARQTRWLKRQGKIDAFEFLMSVERHWGHVWTYDIMTFTFSVERHWGHPLKIRGQ